MVVVATTKGKREDPNERRDYDVNHKGSTHNVSSSYCIYNRARRRFLAERLNRQYTIRHFFDPSVPTPALIDPHDETTLFERPKYILLVPRPT